MKKYISICVAILMAFVALTANGQTTYSFEDAYELNMGRNSCSFKSGEDYNAVCLFSYTATERGLLRIEGESTDVTFTAINADNDELSCIIMGAGCIVPLNIGETVYVRVSPNMTLEYDLVSNFNAEFEANENAGKGVSKDEPIEVKDGKANITLDTAPGFEEFTSYFTYTAQETGALNLSFTNYVLTGKYGSSFDNMQYSFSVEYDNGSYIGSIPVNAGETVCFSVSAYSAMLVTAKMTYPERGTSSNYPIDLKEGVNEVSAEFGEYWYKYNGSDADGYVTISSEYTIPRGHVTVFRANDINMPIAQSETGYYDIRFKVNANASYLIYILKTEESDDWPNPDTFNLSFSPLQKGESASDPIGLTANEVQMLKDENGTFYYAITLSESDDSKMIEMSVTGAGSERCAMSLYDMQEGVYSAEHGTAKVSIEAKQGHSYMLVIEKAATQAAQLMPAVRDIKAGESIKAPITAVVGENKVEKSASVYYAYTATLDGRLSFSFNIPGVVLEFPISANPYDGSYIGIIDGRVTKLDVEKGKTYYIRLCNVTENCTFTMTETEYQPGETMQNALEVNGGEVVLAEGMTNVWFRYVADKDGKMELSSNIIGDPTTFVYYCIGENSYPSAINTSDADGNIIYRASFGVNKGEVVYVHLVSPAERVGSTISFSLMEYGAGESLATAFELIPNGKTISVPHATRTQNQWIRVPLKGIKNVTITTDRFVAGGVFTSTDVNRAYDIEFVADANNEVHTAVYNSENPVEALYVCLTQSNGIIVMKAETTDDPMVGIGSVADGQASVIYNVNGVRQNSLRNGVNIVRKADGGIVKIMK